MATIVPTYPAQRDATTFLYEIKKQKVVRSSVILYEDKTLLDLIKNRENTLQVLITFFHAPLLVDWAMA
jgi:hypothetical protein